MKKILWLSHMLPYPPKGGNLQRSYNLIRELSKYHDVTVIAFNQSKILNTEEKVSSAIEHFSKFCKIQSVCKIPSESTKFSRLLLLLKAIFPWNTYTISWLKSKNFSKSLEKTLKENQFDILYADTISLAPYIVNRQNFQKVLNHHNIESQMLLRRVTNEKNIFKKAYFYWEGLKLQRYEQRTCKKFDLNITCSHFDSVRLAEIAGNLNIVDIPNGVDLEYFNSTPGTKIKPKSLIFVGGLTWYPNLDAITFFLKSVWPLLNKEIPGISLTIIGKSPPEWMCKLQNTYKNLHFLGFVDDIRPYVTEAEIYICPIRDGGGTKLKVLDALAMGKPLVANPIACEGINVEDGETVIFASTPDEYIKEIKSLLSDSDLKSKMSQKSRNLISDQYSFVSIGKNLATNLEHLNVSHEKTETSTKATSLL